MEPSHRKPAAGKVGRRRALLRAAIRAAAILIAAVLASPLIAIVVLRWIDPPTSAFMMRSASQRRFGGDGVPGTATHHPVEAGSPGRVGRAGGARSAIDYRFTPIDRIAPAMAIAVIAAEDQTFPSHHGFDLQSISDAVAERGRRRRLRGASTITQQVAKNLFLWPGRSYARKALEAYLAAAIELCWPKRRILEIYLNVAETGPGLYGVAAAAEVYFRKTPAQLTLREAALIAAALPNPSRRRPDRPSPWLTERAAWIETQIDQLGGVGYLSGILR